MKHPVPWDKRNSVAEVVKRDRVISAAAKRVLLCLSQADFPVRKVGSRIVVPVEMKTEIAAEKNRLKDAPKAG